MNRKVHMGQDIKQKIIHIFDDLVEAFSLDVHQYTSLLNNIGDARAAEMHERASREVG